MGTISNKVLQAAKRREDAEKQLAVIAKQGVPLDLEERIQIEGAYRKAHKEYARAQTEYEHALDEWFEPKGG